MEGKRDCGMILFLRIRSSLEDRGMRYICELGKVERHGEEENNEVKQTS